MQVDEPSVVLASSTTSTLSLALAPLVHNTAIHDQNALLTRELVARLVLGALLGTQNGREVEIVNTFELAVVPDTENTPEPKVDHDFLTSRRDQYKQVFPSLEFIGWYSAAPIPTATHISLHNQFTTYSSTPLLLLLQPNQSGTGQLPIKAYEPTLEIRDRKSRAVYVEAPFDIETGEAERIAVDWTAKGGAGGTSLTSYLATQRAAIKMLHDRIVCPRQVRLGGNCWPGKAGPCCPSCAVCLISSLPRAKIRSSARNSKRYFISSPYEYADVQITAFLSTLTKSTNILNDLVDKHVLVVNTSQREGEGRGGPGGMPPRTRAMGRRFTQESWGESRFH
ncbi:COP9 signalosome subunit 6 [Auriculariales sp. MPI-PUGE-AT-0066]|nr:COP9 signalosome subunit 6 [Auriculariales sp. MPI-PUGE-AT-0066]